MSTLPLPHGMYFLASLIFNSNTWYLTTDTQVPAVQSARPRQQCTRACATMHYIMYLMYCFECSVHVDMNVCYNERLFMTVHLWSSVSIFYCLFLRQ